MVKENERQREAAELEQKFELKATGMNLHLTRTVAYYLYYHTDHDDWEETMRLAKKALISGDYKELHRFYYSESEKRKVKYRERKKNESI